MKIEQPTTLPAGEFEFQVAPGWTHFGDDTRLVLQQDHVELIATVLTGWSEGDRRLQTNATKTAIHSAEEAAKAEGLERAEIDASEKDLWLSRSRATDGAFFGQLVVTGKTSVLYLSCESLSEPERTVKLFEQLLEAVKASKPFVL